MSGGGEHAHHGQAGPRCTSTVWPDGVDAPEELRCGRGAQDGDGGMVRHVLVVDEAALRHGAAPAR